MLSGTSREAVAEFLGTFVLIVFVTRKNQPLSAGVSIVAMGIAAAPIYHKVIRWDRAIPQYHVGHLDRVAWIERRLAQHPGLFLGGNAYHGIGIPDCERMGRAAADAIVRRMRAQRTSA